MSAHRSLKGPKTKRPKNVSHARQQKMQLAADQAAREAMLRNREAAARARGDARW